MKILLAHYRYFPAGGPERYLFNVANALTARNHEIIPFSVRYDLNKSSMYSRYFVDPVGSPKEVYFRQQHMTLRTVWRTFLRLFYAPDVEKAVGRLCDETRPQIAYILQYLRKLSPALLVGLKKARRPMVVRLSDYSMLCPKATCWRQDQPCELCVKGTLLPSLRYRCVRDSLPASILNALATWYHQFKGYFDLVDRFVTTTKFMSELMVEAGFPESKLRHIPTFVESDLFFPLNNKESNTKEVFFAGRLDKDKGVDVLLDAWRHLKEQHGINARLRIVGTGEDLDYVEQLKAKAVADVVFSGELDKANVARLMRSAYVTVIPSLGYDNLPNVMLESYSSGTPVLASNIGSFRESVLSGKTGYLFEANNPLSLADTILRCLDSPDQVMYMSHIARQTALTAYSKENHLTKLEKMFEQLIDNAR